MTKASQRMVVSFLAAWMAFGPFAIAAWRSSQAPSQLTEKIACGDLIQSAEAYLACTRAVYQNQLSFSDYLGKAMFDSLFFGACLWGFLALAAIIAPLPDRVEPPEM